MVALVLDGLVGFPAGLSPTSFHLSPSSFHLSPRLGACGRVPGWLVSRFLSCVSHFFSFVSHVLSVLLICLPGWVLVDLSSTSFHLSPKLGACGRVPGFVSHFFFICVPRPFICLPALFICLPVLFICLPGWVLVVGFPAGLSPASFHVTSFAPHAFNSCPHVVNSPLIEQHDQHHVRT